MPKKVKPKNWDKTNACCAMHVSLRKYCDSAATSALYNFLHLLEDNDPYNPWLFFAGLLVEKLRLGKAKGDALQAAFETYRKRWEDDVLFPHRGDPTVTTPNLQHNVIHCIMRTFNVSDWSALATLLDTNVST